MKIKYTYNQLRLIADQLNIKIMNGRGNFKGGFCVIKEKLVIVLNKNKPFEDRVQNLTFGLLEFDLSSIKIEAKTQNVLDDYQYIKDQK